MAKRKQKRGGWTRDGVKVRERVKGSDVWWVFINHAVDNADGTRSLIRKSVRKGTREAADAYANEIRAGFALVDARQRGLTADELQGIGLAQSEPPVTPTPAAGVTFGSYADRVMVRWEPNDKDPEHGLKFSTWRDYSRCIEKRIGPELGSTFLAALSRTDVQVALDTWRAAGLKGANLKKHRRIVSSIVSQAVEDGLIPVNPLLGGGSRLRRRSKAKQVAQRQDPFTHDELGALFTAAEAHTTDRRSKSVQPFRSSIPLLLCLADTGMRLGEAFGLQWGDIDWRSGTVLVSRSYSHGRIDVPKGGKARRVEMTTRLRTTLRTVYESRFERVVALDAEQQAALEAEQATQAADALIFPDSVGGHLEDHNLRNRVWIPLLTAAKLRKRRLHDLRHTFATLHLQGGTDPIWVSKQLGHHSVAFTLSTYAHLPRNDRGGHADRIVTAPNCTATAPAFEEPVGTPAPEKTEALGFPRAS